MVMVGGQRAGTGTAMHVAPSWGWHNGPPLRGTPGWQLVPAVPWQLRVAGVWPRGHSCRRVPAVPAMRGDPPSPSVPESRSPAPVHRWSSCCEFSPSPVATSGPHLGRGGSGWGGRWSGGFRGPGAAGGRAGAPGRRDEGGRCLGDGAGAGTAAKGCGSCAGWRWLGGAGGTRGFRVPPLPRAGPCSGELPGDPSRCCWWGLLGSRPPDLGTGVSSTLGVASGGGLESDVTECTHPGGQGTLGPGSPQGGTGWAQQ